MTRYIVRDEGTIDLTLALHGPMGQSIRREAIKRSVRVDILAGQLIERVIRDNLVDAILDDQK